MERGQQAVDGGVNVLITTVMRFLIKTADSKLFTDT